MIQFYWPKNLWVWLCSSVYLFTVFNQYLVISAFTELFACANLLKSLFSSHNASPYNFKLQRGKGGGGGKLSVPRAIGMQRNQSTCHNPKQKIYKSAKMYTTWLKPSHLKWRVLMSFKRIFQLGTWPYGEASRILASFSSHGSLRTAAEMSKNCTLWRTRTGPKSMTIWNDLFKSYLKDPRGPFWTRLVGH